MHAYGSPSWQVNRFCATRHLDYTAVQIWWTFLGLTCTSIERTCFFCFIMFTILIYARSIFSHNKQIRNKIRL